jgi:hypothetical protein
MVLRLMNSRPSSFANLGFLEYLHAQILHGLACCGCESYSATTDNYPDEGDSRILRIISTLLLNYTSSHLKNNNHPTLRA